MNWDPSQLLHCWPPPIRARRSRERSEKSLWLVPSHPLAEPPVPTVLPWGQHPALDGHQNGPLQKVAPLIISQQPRQP